MSTAPITKGVHHVGLTVPDLAATLSFFIDTLSFEKVGDIPDYPAAFISDGTTMITLWQAKTPAQAIPFDRQNNIGLHHLAFTVEDGGALRDIHGKLKDRADVEIEFAPESLGGGSTHHLMCFIPGGVRVEFIAPAS